MDELSTLRHNYARLGLSTKHLTMFHRDLTGYTVIYALTEISIGGGLCVMVDKKWATNLSIRECTSTRYYEIIGLLARTIQGQQY